MISEVSFLFFLESSSTQSSHRTELILGRDVLDPRDKALSPQPSAGE